MKHYSKILFVIGIGVVSLASCSMDETPTTSITYEEGEDMITTDNDLTEFENGLHTSFRSCFYGSRSIPSEVMCDGFNATVDYGNNYGGVHRMDATFTASDYDTRDLWAYNYSAIKDYNVFIDEAKKYTPSSTSSTTLKTVGIGEAHFYRAYAYLELVRHFAKAYDSSTASSDLGVPLVLHYDQQAKPARATVQEVYDQIKADLDTAATNLASVAGAIGSKTPTIDAVNAVYARYYLDIQDYTNAAAYAQLVINSTAGYALSDDADAMEAEYSDDSGTEPIMQLYASITENGSGTNSVYTNTDTYGAFAAYNGTGWYTTPYFLPSQKLIDLYEANDLRLAQWFDYNSLICYLGGNIYLPVPFYTFTKYLGNMALTSGTYPNSRQCVKPLLIAEQYLILAEAEYRLSDTDAAKTALNTIQSARGATTTDATWTNIENEWFKETVGEGLRFSCLKRWGEGYSGRAGQTGALEYGVLMTTGDSYTTKELAADDYHWVWPIPSYDMRVNDNLVQNPGYASSSDE